MDSDFVFLTGYFIGTLFWAALLGLIPGAIAHNKGHSFLAWWFFGAAIFIIALPASLMLNPNVQERERVALSSGGRKCPHCAEIIRLEAKVCRFCGRDIEQQLNSSKLNQSDEYYYKQGLGFMRAGFYNEAKLEFLKAIQVSPSKGKWYSSSQARLMEIRASGREIKPLQSVASNQTNISSPKLQVAAQRPPERLCPKCDLPMEIKVADKGEHQGKSFYVCPNYKQCQQVVPTTPATNETKITKEFSSKLTFRQKYSVTEYGYLLSPENAEIVGQMLRSNAKKKDILSFCEINGKKITP